MSKYITVDGGTTNTRICLADNYEIIDCRKYPVGARANAQDKGLLEKTLKKGIKDILSDNKMKECEIECVLASGMITSEFGINELEHICVPAGKKQLHDTMFEDKSRSITELSVFYIRGIKMAGDNLWETDMMRGEESETIGLLREDLANCVYVLPGTHSKVIFVEDGQIKRFSTMLTGEMIEALSEHTILSEAVKLENTHIDNEFLWQGYEFCRDSGINKALFKVRVLKNILNKDNSQIYSFFMGVILQGEIAQILAEQPKNVVVGGKKQIKKAMVYILRRELGEAVTEVGDKEAEQANSIGMIRIFESD